MIDRRYGVLLLGVVVASACPAACGTNSPAVAGGGGSTTSMSTTTQSHSSSSSASSSSASAENIGLSCLSDSDCGGSLTCLLPTANDPILGGGPANGYCTAGCTTNQDCPGINSVCIRASKSGPGICLLTCDLGPALTSLNDELDPNKCLGRDDVRCWPLDSGLNVCVPTCGQDSQCPVGRVCDPRLSVCVDQPSAGLPDGAHCETDPSDAGSSLLDCASTCIHFIDGVSACAKDCVLGGDLLTGASCGGISAGLCAYRSQDNGAGDFGFCTPSCLQQDDCQIPAFWCTAITNLTGRSVKNGFCLGATACPNGNTDCAKAPNTVCTTTKYGPFCLTNVFPLGGAVPPADAGADSGQQLDAGSSADAADGG